MDSQLSDFGFPRQPISICKIVKLKMVLKFPIFTSGFSYKIQFFCSTGPKEKNPPKTQRIFINGCSFQKFAFTFQIIIISRKSEDWDIGERILFRTHCRTSYYVFLSLKEVLYNKLKPLLKLFHLGNSSFHIILLVLHYMFAIC